jgi:hypothetical protein
MDNISAGNCYTRPESEYETAGGSDIKYKPEKRPVLPQGEDGTPRPKAERQWRYRSCQKKRKSQSDNPRSKGRPRGLEKSQRQFPHRGADLLRRVLQQGERPATEANGQAPIAPQDIAEKENMSQSDDPQLQQGPHGRIRPRTTRTTRSRAYST